MSKNFIDFRRAIWEHFDKLSETSDHIYWKCGVHQGRNCPYHLGTF